MLGQVVRAAELPISLSLGIARKGVALTARVAGWAVTGLIRELTPDREVAPQPVTEEPPAREPVSEEPPAAEVVAEEPPAAQVVTAEPEAAQDTPAAYVATAELVADEPPQAASPPEAPSGEEMSPPPIGGEEGATVEHEPGLGTSVRARSPHSALNNPVTEPDLTEWPDPYDHREDPRDPGEEMVFGADEARTPPGATSTSEPHPSQDPEAERWEGPKRDKVDQ